jgi:hypothetical protein
VFAQTTRIGVNSDGDGAAAVVAVREQEVLVHDVVAGDAQGAIQAREDPDDTAATQAAGGVVLNHPGLDDAIEEGEMRRGSAGDGTACQPRRAHPGG